jgi:squalene-hopene/tetraprenyl-beta-curcumene cyclase
MRDEINRALEGALARLRTFQLDDGRFEGRLSSNIYPTCSFAVIERLLGETVDEGIIEWLLERQNPDGTWGLDTSGRSDPQATALARTVLRCIRRDRMIPEVEAALKRSSPIAPSIFHVKLLAALLGEMKWEEVLPARGMGVGIKLLSLLPRAIRENLKPPPTVSPPPELFLTSIFEELFIAEQHTLVPILLMIELERRGGSELAWMLLEWLLARRLPDGSWFRVNFITSLSTMALIQCRAWGFEGLDPLIEESVSWLEETRNPDGGFREAVNLNVWDTALSVYTMLEAGVPRGDPAVERACRWLMDVQNEDGGWPFSGVPWSGLPSDADDTALATLALIKAGHEDKAAVQNGLAWLLANQAKEGYWSTYVPGEGDVGCVSITAHTSETLMAVEGMDRELKRALDWLERRINPQGYWDDLWLARNTYGTACAITVLAKCGRGESESVRRGLKWLKSRQNPDGGWGEDMFGRKAPSTIEQTAWSVYALILGEGKVGEEVEWGLRFLLERQRPDGGWNPSCVGIYWEVIGGYEDPIYALVFPILALSSARRRI